MLGFTFLALGILFSIGLFALLAALQRGWVRAVAAIFYAPLVFSCLWFSAQILGAASPFRPAPDVAISWYALKEPESIFVLVDENGTPRLHVLPWSVEKAKELLGAAAEAAETGGTLMLRGEGDEGGERMFWSEPPEPLPPKE